MVVHRNRIETLQVLYFYTLALKQSDGGPLYIHAQRILIMLMLEKLLPWHGVRKIDLLITFPPYRRSLRDFYHQKLVLSSIQFKHFTVNR